MSINTYRPYNVPISNNYYRPRVYGNNMLNTVRGAHQAARAAYRGYEMARPFVQQATKYIPKKYGSSLRGSKPLPPKQNYSNKVSTVGVISNDVARVVVKKTKNKKAKPLTAMTMLMDICCPKAEENYRETSSQIDWIANAQGVQSYVHMQAAKITEMIAKIADINNIANLTATQSYQKVLWYTGGWQKHTFMNSCSHTCTIHIMEYICKKDTTRLPSVMWASDLTRDQTLLNVVAPINIEQTTTTSGLLPKKNSIELNMFWKQIKIVTVKLPPGETYVYFMRAKAFKFNQGKYLIQTNGVTSDYIANISKSLMVSGYAELVTDSTSTAITTGSGHIAHNAEHRNYFRAVFPTSVVNRYNSGTYGDIALQASEQSINRETDAQDAGYVEDL